MADTKITALAAIATVDPAADVLPIVDISDTSMAASGTTKKITSNQILGSGGTATLASATITGDLTAARLIVTGGTIPANGLWLPTTNTLEFSANSLAQYRIAPLGVFSWYDGAGGTRMTLDSTGLGVGVSPSYTIHAKKVLSGTSTTVNGLLYLENTGAGNSAKITLTDGVSNNGYIVYSFETGTPTLGLGVGSAQQLVVNSSGNVGIGVAPSAGGGCLQLKSGITFPATQVASSDANTLDDYEEGTFTPSIGGTATYTTQTGRYVKIGNRVWVTIRLVINTAGTGDDYRISGLPFVVASTIAPISVGYFAGLKISVGYISGYANTGTSTITTTATTAASANITNGAGVITNNTDLAISCFYEV